MRRRWAVLLAIGLATSVLVALALAQLDPPRARPTPRRHPPARPVVPRLVWGPAPSPAIAIDAGAPLDLDAALAIDAVLDEAEPELGPLPRELVERLCPAAARAICAGRAGCGCEQDAAECEGEIATACELWVRCRWGWAGDDGSTVPPQIDPGALRGCTEGMARSARGCRDVERPMACDDLIVEDFGPGEECTDEGVRCVGGICRAGRCQPFPRIGEECPDAICAEDAICYDERCVPSAGLGRGRPCEADGECAWELACMGGRCRSRRGPGGACVGDAQCAIGARCEDRVCTRADRCDLTHGCGDGRTCIGDEGARCEATELGEAREAEPCGAGCGPDLQCDGLRCVALPQLGEACPRGLCAGELRCTMRPTGPVCLATGLAAGALCVPGWDAPCGPGLGCAWAGDDELGTYRCARTVGRGEDCREAPCGRGDACVFGVVEGECRPAICDPVGASAAFACGEE